MQDDLSSREQSRRAARCPACVLLFGLSALWGPLVLATGIAVMARPLLGKIARVTGGRRRAAGVLVVLLVLLMLTPLATLIVSLSRGATDLVRNVIQSEGAKATSPTPARAGEV